MSDKNRWWAARNVPRWFAEITRKKIRRGTFRSVRDLIKEIHDYIRIYNSNPRPFQRVANASRIIRKVKDIDEPQKQRASAAAERPSDGRLPGRYRPALVRSRRQDHARPVDTRRCADSHSV